MLTRTPRGSSNKNHLLARGVMLWRCIADDYEQTILVGKYENGAKLPAESEIAARYGDAGKVYRRLRSITRTLDHYGIKGYARKWTRISAGFTDAVDAGRLRLSVQRPILVVESLDVAGDGTPILTTRGRFAADRVALTVES